MAGPARRLALPNGLEVAYQSKAELQQFYDDIFEKRVYTRRGIRLRDGDCVFDVGANIGLFTLYAAHHHPGARIFSFEPAPPVFELLKANTAGLGGRVRLFNCGLGVRPGRATLTFYPHSSGMSSFYPDEAQEKAALRVLIRGELARRAEVEQILPHERPQRNPLHQSRRLLPVSERNTSSRLTVPAVARLARSRSTESSATTLPRSMMTTRSARRSASSM